MTNGYGTVRLPKQAVRYASRDRAVLPWGTVWFIPWYGCGVSAMYRGAVQIGTAIHPGMRYGKNLGSRRYGAVR